MADNRLPKPPSRAAVARTASNPDAIELAAIERAMRRLRQRIDRLRARHINCGRRCRLCAHLQMDKLGADVLDHLSMTSPTLGWAIDSIRAHVRAPKGDGRPRRS